MKDKSQTLTIQPRIVALIIFLAILISVAWMILTSQSPNPNDPIPDPSNPNLTQNPILLSTPTTISSSTPPYIGYLNESNNGYLIFSMLDGDYFHLYAFYPGSVPLQVISSGEWDDVHPAISPDGTMLAFSSRRSGYFDIYIWNLETEELIQVTSSPQYDGHPSWSPDSQWLVFESYEEDNLDIFIQSVLDLDQTPINLTHHAASDYEPVWSPAGRSIAFTSTRTGDQEIWFANLDQVDQRFINLSQASSSQENFPVWSNDGGEIFWTSDRGGISQVYQWNASNPESPATVIAIGSQTIQVPNTQTLITILNLPGQISIIGYTLGSSQPDIPQSTLLGQVNGITWISLNSYQLLNEVAQIQNASNVTSVWEPIITLSPQPNGRFGLVSIEGVNAPFPFLQDNIDESFNLLRQRIGYLTGWSFLSTLENAYLPLTEPPTPGNLENWLLTGRAISVNPLPLPAGWMVIAREDSNGRTFWRIYLRAYRQDGSQGFPLRQMPWNLDARYARTPTSYEQGGNYIEIPPGYWIDFTAYAELYGWQRIPALNNWRSYYQGAQFTLYALTGGLDWGAAMHEIYPSEALATYTPIPTSTSTSTPTRRMTPTRTPTRTTTFVATSTFSNFPSLTATP